MRFHRALAVSLLLPLAAGGCLFEETFGGDVRPGETFTLRMGDTARLVGTGTRVTFDDVPSDGRCPEGAHCAWEGSATVIVTAGESAPVRHELRTVRRDPGSPRGNDPTRDDRTTRLDGHVLRLLELTPGRRLGADIPPDDYRARFRIDPD